MPAASYYSLFVGCLLPPLGLLAALRLCWFFGILNRYPKHAVFLVGSTLIAALLLLAIWALASVEWTKVALWIRVPTVLGLYGGVVAVATLLWSLFALRDHMLSSPSNRTNWLTGLSFSIATLVALLIWSHGFGEFDIAPLSQTSMDMLSLRRFDLMSVATILVAVLAFGEARHFGDLSQATGISTAWRVGLACGLMSALGNVVSSDRLSFDELARFAAERTAWPNLADYELDRFLSLNETIWQRDAIGCLAILVIALLTLFHAVTRLRLAASHLRTVGTLFVGASLLVLAGFVFLYPGTEFVRDPQTDHHFPFLIGVIGGAALGILMPEFIRLLARWCIAPDSPAFVKLITPPWLILSFFGLTLMTAKLAVPRHSFDGHGYIIETAIQFGIFSFALHWAIRYGIAGQAGDETLARNRFTESQEA